MTWSVRYGDRTAVTRMKISLLSTRHYSHVCVLSSGGSQLRSAGFQCCANSVFSLNRIVALLFEISNRINVIVGLKSHHSKYLLNKFNCFYGTSLLWFFTCDSIYAIAHICYHPSVRSPVRPSVCQMGGSWKNG